MNEDKNIITLADAAAEFHAAELAHDEAVAALAGATQKVTETRPVYYRAISDAMADGVGLRAMARTIGEACGRSKSSVERDVARVVVMNATGWDDAQTVSETPNIGGTGPSCGAVKSAATDAEDKKTARAAVRALFAPVAEPADEPADEPAEESAPVDHGTQPGPDAVNIHEDMTARIVAYLESHEDLNDGVKNLTARAREAYATLGITVKV